MRWRLFQTNERRSPWRRWATSLVGGTLLGTWTGVVGLAVWKRNVWLVVPGVLLGTALAGMQIVVLGSVDLTFAALRVRRLPVGPRAWFGAFVAPAAVAAGVRNWPIPAHHGTGTFVLSGVGPMVLSSAAIRLLCGKR